MKTTTPRMPVPAPRAKPKLELDLPWYQRVPRRNWLVLIVVELIAVALLFTGISRGDPLALAGGLGLALVYGPLRAGGFTYLRRRFAKQKPDRRDETFYRRRK